MGVDRPRTSVHVRHNSDGSGAEAVDHRRPGQVSAAARVLPVCREGVEAGILALRASRDGEVEPRGRHGELPQVRRVRPRADERLLEFGPAKDALGDVESLDFGD